MEVLYNNYATLKWERAFEIASQSVKKIKSNRHQFETFRNFWIKL